MNNLESNKWDQGDAGCQDDRRQSETDSFLTR